MLQFGHWINRESDNINVISQKALVKLLNKTTSLQTLTLIEVQLSDMVSPP